MTGNPDRLIDVVLNGMQGKIEVNGKFYDELMPAHTHLDDNAIASIVTFVRKRFGGIEGETIKEERIRKVRDNSNTYNLLIGTYTSSGKSVGIYVYEFNSETGDFNYKSEAAGITNPSYLAISKDRKKYIFRQ